MRDLNTRFVHDFIDPFVAYFPIVSIVRPIIRTSFNIAYISPMEATFKSQLFL